jgi:hypothetical protein
MQTRFICRFAVGARGIGYSATWRVWTAKKQPDLYIAARSIAGEIKATIHAPRAPRYPNWERHYGYDKNAVSAVAKQGKLDGGPHKVTWTGCPIGECTLECRVIIRGTSLDDGMPVSDDVALLPIPGKNEYVEVAVILGPKGPTDHIVLRERDGESHPLSEGRFSDGRRVWVVYCVRAMKQDYSNPVQAAPPMPGKSFLNSKADLTHGRHRAVVVGAQDDGSLALWDMKVECPSRG